MAEIHKLLLEKGIRCSLEEIRQRDILLHYDSHMENEVNK